MKVFSLIFVVVAMLIASSSALKDAICGEQTSKNSAGLIACTGYLEAWSYDSAQNDCVKFIYGGCGGNANRFFTQAECEAKCKE